MSRKEKSAAGVGLEAIVRMLDRRGSIQRKVVIASEGKQEGH